MITASGKFCSRHGWVDPFARTETKSSTKAASQIYFTNIIILIKWIFKNFSSPFGPSGILFSSCPARLCCQAGWRTDNKICCEDWSFEEGETLPAITGTITTVSILSSPTVWVVRTASIVKVFKNWTLGKNRMNLLAGRERTVLVTK